MPQVFRPSSRALLLQSVLLATTSWLVLRLGLQLDAWGATAASLAALGCHLGAQLLTRPAAPCIVLADDRLSVIGAVRGATIELDEISRVELDTGALSDGGHPLHVGFAMITTERGERLAVSDLSSLGQVSLRTPDGSAEIVDVAEPELLVAIAAHRSGHPLRPSSELEAATPGALRQWLAPSPLTAARVVLALLAARAVLNALLDPRTRPFEVIGGLGLAILAIAAARASQRDSNPGGADVTEADAARSLAVLGATGAVASLAAPRHVAAWCVAWAFSLAMPIAPLPGGLVARALGRRLAGSQSAIRAALLAIALVVAAALFALARPIPALALIAAVFECGEGFNASRRHAVIQSSAALQAASAPALAGLRARLRPVSDDTVEAQSRARDHAEIALALRPASPVGLGGILSAAGGLAALLVSALILAAGGDARTVVALERWLE